MSVSVRIATRNRLRDTEVYEMLVLTRKEGERIALGDDIVVTVVSIQGNKVRLGVVAPDDVTIRRGELIDAESPTIRIRQLAEQI